MKLKLFTCISICILVAIPCTITKAESGYWYNHAGPWFMPHDYHGDPAFGRDNGIVYWYDGSAQGFEPDQYGIFRSLDFGNTWDLVDQEMPPTEIACLEEYGKIAWACGQDDDCIRRTVDGGEIGVK